MRKTLTTVLGIAGFILAFFRDQFGLQGLQLEQILILLFGSGGLLLYALFEARTDLQRIKNVVAQQKNKWIDPKFWCALLSGLLAYLSTVFNWNIPAEFIVIGLNIIMTLIFGKDYKKAKAGI